MGYDGEFYNSEGVKHRDNRFIGVHGDPDDGWTLAYCDSTTAEIYEQDIFEEIDGEKILVDVETVVLENREKTINKEDRIMKVKEVIKAAIQEKHQETIEKLDRLWEQYNKEFNEDPRKCNKEEYVQKSEYLLGYCSGLMEVCRMLVQDIK